jgi:thiamine-monophosphate kinase
VDRFFSGLLSLARQHKVELAGGDTAQSPGGLLADIVVVGSLKRGTGLLRSGARVGDHIYVTGELGESAAALEFLKAQKIRRRDLFPEPRVAVGEWLRRNQLASAAIDISDGLSTDLAHICDESGVGAVLEAEAIPIHAAAQNLRRDGGRDLPLDLALHGGEDYELLFTATQSQRVPPRIAGVKITRIGEVVTRTKKMSIVRQGQKEVLLPRGWEHFGSSSSGL